MIKTKKILSIIMGLFVVLTMTSSVVYAKDSADDSVNDDATEVESENEDENETEVELEDESKTEDDNDANDDSRLRINDDIRGSIKTMREGVKAEVKEIKNEIKSVRDAAKNEIKLMKDSGSTKEEIKSKIEAIRKANEVKREEFKTLLEQKRETIKTEIRTAITNFKEGKKIILNEEKREKIKERLSGTFEKLSEVIVKIEGFDKRISDAIINRQTKGLDTVAAETALGIARQSLDETKVLIGAVNTAIAESIDDADGSSKEAVKSAINKAVESIKNTKSKYEDVIKALPKIPTDSTASSTTE